MAEAQVFGPPGTGKTTYLSRQIRRATRKYHSEDVVACSFTRAAAKELTGRNEVLPTGNIGTIHGLCYHALDQPPIAETERGFIEQWNEHHPEWRIEAESTKGLDEPVSGGPLLAYSHARSTFDDPPNPEFAREWEKSKADEGVMDFTDLLLNAPDTLNARVLMVDEAQDLTPLQWRIVRQWGAGVEWFITCGDDDQLLYSFLGADPEPLLRGDAEYRTILDQSYRIPRAVHKYSQEWIQKLGGRRVDKPFNPREEVGTVQEREMSLRHPADLVSELHSKTNAGKNAMILASCGYMLRPLIKELRRRGLAYHNPYRRARGDWNPLGTTGQRILSFLYCCNHAGEYLSAKKWYEWIEMLRSSECLQHGGKTWLREQAEDSSYLHIEQLDCVLGDPAVIDCMERRDVRWLQGHATQRFEWALEYPCAVYESLGTSGLRQNPNIIVGTVHSVKGGEADVVYLSPDISRAAQNGLNGAREWHREALIRQFYVGMTRAKQELHLLDRSTKHFIYW